MPLGIEVGLSPDDIVWWGPAPPSKKRGTAPNFRPVSLVAKRSLISATAELLLCLFIGSGVDGGHSCSLAYFISMRLFIRL